MYPFRDQADGVLRTVENLKVSSGHQDLFSYLVAKGLIRNVEHCSQDLLHIFSRDVLQKISVGDDSWQDMVPDAIAETITRKHFFGYRDSAFPAPSGS